MPTLISGPEIVINETSAESDPWKIQSKIIYRVPEFLIAAEIIGSGDFDWEQENVNIGASYIGGNALTGFEFTALYNPSTDQARLELGGAQFGLGGDISITLERVNGQWTVAEYSGFVGANIILGQQGEFLGITAGQAGSLKYGFFFEPDGTIDVGFQASFTQGVIVGSFDAESSTTMDILQARDMTVAQIKAALDEIDPDLWDKFRRLDHLETLNIFGISKGMELLDSWDKTCFAAGTMITLADGSKKPIEDILPDDWVMSFNPETGETVPARVTRTFTNDVKILLNFFGTFVTPGHVYYCAGGRFEGGFVTLIDILRDDGAVQDAEGNLIRACTGATVGGELDRFVEVVTADPQPDGALKVRETGRLRAGSRVILDDGRDFALADIIAAGGGTILDNGMIATDDNPAGTVYHWTFSRTLPQPEDYVLQRSATSLEEIYRIAEWEQSGPALLAPTTLDGGHVKPASNIDIHVAPRNDPHAYSGGFNPLGRR